MKRGGLGSRLLVAAWGIPHLLGLTWLGGWWTTALIAGISLMALNEYYQLQYILGRKPVKLPGLIAGLLVVLMWMIDYSSFPWILITIFLVIATIALLRGRSHLDIVSTFGGICYIPLLAGSFVFLREWEGGGQILNEGRWLALCVLGAIWICDTAAYAGGRLMGKHKLASSISPNKTVEGFLFGLFGAILFCLIWHWFDLIQLDVALAVGIAAGVLGQGCDLFESALKRECGVKDAGSLLPGHGGILDRFDSFLFTVPSVAMYLAVRPAFSCFVSF